MWFIFLNDEFWEAVAAREDGWAARASTQARPASAEETHDGIII